MLYAIKLSSFLCFALIHNVTLRVKVFRGKTPTLRGPERLGKPPPRNAKSARLAAFDKIGNVFSFTYLYSPMTAQQFRQLDGYCRHLYFMKVSHEINCCVFKPRVYIANNLGFSYLAAILDAILDFSARHHLCQFMLAVSYTTDYTEHFGI